MFNTSLLMKFWFSLKHKAIMAWSLSKLFIKIEYIWKSRFDQNWYRCIYLPSFDFFSLRWINCRFSSWTWFSPSIFLLQYDISKYKKEFIIIEFITTKSKYFDWVAVLKTIHCLTFSAVDIQRDKHT